MTSLAAVVLAESPTSYRIAGLTLAERARRVAERAGAAQVRVVTTAAERRALAASCPRVDRLLVLRASDQLVHPPLVAPLLELPGEVVAVAAEGAPAGDVAAGGYAGAFVTDDVERTLAALAAGASDADLAAQARARGAICRAHGAVARHPVRDPDERAAAERLLYTILVKPQDNAITRALFRPVSLWITKRLVGTPITPNQVTTITLCLVALGLWLVAQPSLHSALWGSALMVVANYVDCCDGEIARLKLASSRAGAWYDTIVDESASFGYMLAIGWHCHLALGPAYLPQLAQALGRDPWLVAMVLGAIAYAVALYCVYFNIIFVAGSANSQDYASRVTLTPGPAPGTWALRPVRSLQSPPSSPRWIAAALAWAPNLVRRDFIVWACLALVAAGLPHVLFAGMVVGGVVTAGVVALDHVILREQLHGLRAR